jgi:chemotaxis protein histidine kinase CheA
MQTNRKEMEQTQSKQVSYENIISGNAKALNEYFQKAFQFIQIIDDDDIKKVLEEAFSSTDKDVENMIRLTWVNFYEIMYYKITDELMIKTDIIDKWNEIVKEYDNRINSFEDIHENNDLADTFYGLISKRDDFIYKNIILQMNVNFSERFAPIIMASNVSKLYTPLEDENGEKKMFNQFIRKVFNNFNLFQIGMLGFISEDEITSVIFGNDVDQMRPSNDNSFKNRDFLNYVTTREKIITDGCRALILSAYNTWIIDLKDKIPDMMSKDKMNDPTSKINEALVTVLIPIIFASVGSTMISISKVSPFMHISAGTDKIWHSHLTRLSTFPCFEFVTDEEICKPPPIDIGSEPKHDVILGIYNHSIRSNVFLKTIKQFRSFPMTEFAEVVQREKRTTTIALSDRVKTPFHSKKRIEERNRLLYSFFSVLISYHSSTESESDEQQKDVHDILLGKKWLDPSRYKKWFDDKKIRDTFLDNPLPKENRKTFHIRFEFEFPSSEEQSSLSLSFGVEEEEEEEKEKARRKAEEARRKAEEKARRKAEEARRKAQEARRKAQEKARRKAKEEAKRKAEEEAKRKAEEEARRKAKEEARRKAKEEARRKAKEEARRKAKEEAKRKAEEEAKRKAEEEAKRKAEEEEEEESASLEGFSPETSETSPTATPEPSPVKTKPKTPGLDATIEDIVAYQEELRRQNIEVVMSAEDQKKLNDQINELKNTKKELLERNEKNENKLEDINGLALKGRIYDAIIEWMAIKEMSEKIEVILDKNKGVAVLILKAQKLKLDPASEFNDDDFMNLVIRTAIANEKYPDAKKNDLETYEDKVRDTYGFDPDKINAYTGSSDGSLSEAKIPESIPDSIPAKEKEPKAPPSAKRNLPLHKIYYTDSIKADIHKALSLYMKREVSMRMDKHIAEGDYVDISSESIKDKVDISSISDSDDGETEVDRMEASLGTVVNVGKSVRAKTSLFDHSSSISTQVFTHTNSKDEPTRNWLMARIEDRYAEKFLRTRKGYFGKEFIADGISSPSLTTTSKKAKPKRVFDLYRANGGGGGREGGSQRQQRSRFSLDGQGNYVNTKYTASRRGVPMYHYGRGWSPPISKRLSAFTRDNLFKDFPEEQAKESITNLVGCSLAILSTSICTRVPVRDIIFQKKDNRWKCKSLRSIPQHPRFNGGISYSGNSGISRKGKGSLVDNKDMQRKLGQSLASRDRFDSSCRSTNNNKLICPGIFERIIRKWEELVFTVHGISLDLDDGKDVKNGEDRQDLITSLRKVISQNVMDMIMDIMDGDVVGSKGKMYNLCKLADFPEGLRVTMANVVEEMHSCVEEFRYSKTQRRTAMKNLVKRVHDIHIVSENHY